MGRTRAVRSSRCARRSTPSRPGSRSTGTRCRVPSGLRAGRRSASSPWCAARKAAHAPLRWWTACQRGYPATGAPARLRWHHPGPERRQRQGAPVRFKLTRHRGGREREARGDAAAVAAVLERAARDFSSHPADFDLAIGAAELLERAPTDDLRALVNEGIDEDELYERELRPNWEGLSQGERAGKVVAFARFANSLVGDTGPVGPLVRTKLLVLAWAYDRTY